MNQERYKAVVKKLDKLKELRQLSVSEIFMDLKSIIAWNKGLEKIENKLLRMQSFGCREPLPRLPDAKEVYKLLNIYDVCSSQDISIFKAVSDFLTTLLHAIQSEVCDNCMYSWYDKEGTCRKYCNKYLRAMGEKSNEET